MTLKWHIRTDDHSYTMLFEGGTPLNNSPIEIHANSSMFALRFWPHVTIFCIFWLHECLKWRLEFNSKSLFWCQSRQTFEVRAIEQRHHEFQLIHMPPHQFWPRYYHSDGLSPVRVRFEFFSKQICNVEALICHFYKNIKTLTQIHFPRDAHIFRTCTIFYRHYKGAPNAEGFSVVRPCQHFMPSLSNSPLTFKRKRKHVYETQIISFHNISIV